MPTFTATVEFQFDSDSLETAGSELRKLQGIANAAGFTLVSGQVVQPITEGDDRSGGTGYGPRLDQDE